MSYLCTHARSQLLSALVDSRVNNVLLHTMPDINKVLLQLIHVVHALFIGLHSLLYDSPDHVIDLDCWAFPAAATEWCHWRDVPERCLVGRIFFPKLSIFPCFQPCRNIHLAAFVHHTRSTCG